VVRREDGLFLGDCGPMLQLVDGVEVPEIGYHIVRAEWGRGYATEAALACRDWFFANTTHDRLVSIVWPPNTASRNATT
jgi:RimJ/RimL family protein N-acetyltransferase